MFKIGKKNVEKYGLLLFVLLSFEMQAQEKASVEKSIFGIQAGLVGIYVNNETKLSNTIALRSEAGLKTTNWGISNFYREKPIIPLVLTVEPRWYFNIKRLYAKGLRIENNAAMSLSLMIRHNAGWCMLLGKQPSNIEFIPTIAYRFNIGKHFNFEMGGGMGYQYAFTSIEEEKNYWAFNIVLRIGYVF